MEKEERAIIKTFPSNYLYLFGQLVSWRLLHHNVGKL